MSQNPRFSPQKQHVSGHATTVRNAPAGVHPPTLAGVAAIVRGLRNPRNPRGSDSFSNGPPRSRAISAPPLPRLLGGRSARASLLDRGDHIPHQLNQKAIIEARARQSLAIISQRWGQVAAPLLPRADLLLVCFALQRDVYSSADKLAQCGEATTQAEMRCKWICRAVARRVTS